MPALNQKMYYVNFKIINAMFSVRQMILIVPNNSLNIGLILKYVMRIKKIHVILIVRQNNVSF